MTPPVHDSNDGPERESLGAVSSRHPVDLLHRRPELSEIGIGAWLVAAISA